MMDWIWSSLLEEKMISPEDMDLLKIIDDPKRISKL